MPTLSVNTNVDVDINVDIECAVCGDDLGAVSRGNTEVKVEPCKRCTVPMMPRMDGPGGFLHWYDRATAQNSCREGL
jgi:hypothetical protein